MTSQLPPGAVLRKKPGARPAAKSSITLPPGAVVRPSFGGRGSTSAQQVQPMPADFLGTLADIGQQIPVGINKGASAIPGLPGDLEHMFNALDTKMGWAPAGGAVNYLPTSADTQAAWEKLSGPLPKAKTDLGRYAERSGEMLAGGGGGITRAAVTAALGGIGSQGLEDLMNKLPTAVQNPTVSAIASVLGGIGGTLLARGRAPNAVKIAARNAPTLADITALRRGEFRALNNQGITIPAPDVRNTTNAVSRDLRNSQVYSNVAPSSTNVEATLRSLPTRGTLPRVIPGNPPRILPGQPAPDIPFGRIHNIRKEAGRAANLPISPMDPRIRTDRMGGAIIGRHLDDLIDRNLTPAQRAQFARANELASREIRARDIASINVSAPGYTGGVESGTRGQVSALYKKSTKGQLPGLPNPRRSPLELEALRQVLEGGPITSRLRKLGNWGQRTAAILIGAKLGHLPGAVAAHELIEGGKALSGRATARALQRAEAVTLATQQAQRAAILLAHQRALRRGDATLGGIFGSFVPSSDQ